MINNLFSTVLNRKPEAEPASQAARLPQPAAPDSAPPAISQPAASAPQGAGPADAGRGGAGQADAGQAQAAARAEFIRRHESQRAAAQAWISGQQLLQSLLADPAIAAPQRLERHGWKAYSQNDEDGIIAEIFRRIGVVHKTFVEFGSGDGLENNTAYLLAQGWRGLWMDGDENNAALIARGFAPLLAHGLLQFTRELLTRDNIDALIDQANLGREIDLLSIDIDGNDIYLWDAIKSVSARVVVLEYNAKFPPPHVWRVAYNPSHNWHGDDYMGASLSALEQMGRTLGYRLVGCNLAGANAFFVREDLVGEHFATPATPEHLYQPARYNLIYAYSGGHGASSIAIVQGACDAAGIAFDPTKVAVTFKPELP